MSRFLARAAVALSCALFALASSAPAALAAWSHDPAVNTPVCNLSGDQWAPVSALDGAGGFLVAWYDWRGGNADIYLQRFDAAGRALWASGGVLVCGAAGDQMFVRMVADGAGGALLTWQDGRGTASKVFAQRVNSAGVPLWTADGVGMGLVQIAVVQANPDLVQTGAGTCAIAWEQAGQIYAQRVSSTGSLQWGTSPMLVCNATGTQAAPHLAYESTAGATAVYIAWEDPRAGNLDLYAQRISTAGVVQWTANGIAICAASGDQDRAALHWDRTGGAWFAWTDRRSGNRDVYAQRLTSAGAAQWTADGIVVCNDASEQWAPAVVTGGSGKLIIGWEDWRDGAGDPYAQCLNTSGVPQWTANGAALCQAAGHQTNPDWVYDGDGGVIAAWEDQRDGVGYDVYAQRLNAGGVRQWGANGVAVCRAPDNQYKVTVTATSTPLTFVAWQDQRAQNSTSDLYAQALDEYGLLGGAPAIDAVKDVNGDQGGQVVVRWNAAGLDLFPSFAIRDYLLYRKLPAATTWTLLDSVDAAGLPGYAYVASTVVDSVAGSNPRTAFYVLAREANTSRTWASPADSGYSVDNLVPPVPGQFTATWESGVTRLSWSASAAPDLAAYRVWRGAAESFEPGPETFVGDVSDTRWSASGAPPGWYRVAALDVHGNAGLTAAIAPAGIAGAGPPVMPGLVLDAPSPNPLHVGSAIRFSLPRAASVRLLVHDAQGRAVRLLADGPFAAGVHAISWDGRDSRGRDVASALYFLRLETCGRALTRRLAVVR